MVSSVHHYSHDDSFKPIVMSFSFHFDDDHKLGDDDDAPADDDDDAPADDDAERAVFQLEVDVTIRQESVATLTPSKQLVLRTAFALVLFLPVSDVAILSIVDLVPSRRLVGRTLESGAASVLFALTFDADKGVAQVTHAVTAAFTNGTLVSALGTLGMPVQLELNAVTLVDAEPPPTPPDDDAPVGPGDDNADTGDKVTPADIIVGTSVGGAAAIFVAVVYIRWKQGVRGRFGSSRVAPPPKS